MGRHEGRGKLAAVAARERRRNKRILRALGIVVAVAVAFAVGFFVRGQEQLLAGLGFALPEGNSAPAQVADAQRSAYNSVAARVAEVEDVVNGDSLDAYALDDSTSAVLKAFADATEDVYLEYLDPARYSAYVKESSEGSYAGVGVLFSDYNGRAYVADVFDGSAAAAAGVQQGDYVVAIDGDRSHDWSVTEVLGSLAREDGATAVITWMRPSDADAEKGEEFTTALECSTYTEPNVTTSLEGTVGVISLRQFTQNAAELVAGAVSDLGAQGATSYVIDVRDNPGGYLTQAVDAANLFVKSGVIVEVETRTGTTTKTATGKTATDAPLVVLTNSYTSAAAEVFAAALQDNQRATVVGQTTIGKGSVQVVSELSFGGALRYTVAYYKSPLGHDLDGVGVIPDVPVDAGDAGSDAQMLLAVETAQSLAER